MTVNERLFEAGLLDAFEAAAERHDSKAVARILRQVSLTDSDIEGIVSWLWTSPQSRFNNQPVTLDKALTSDERVMALDLKGRRIVQHLFEGYGGSSNSPCLWSGCNHQALSKLNYCAYCAYAHQNIYQAPVA